MGRDRLLQIGLCFAPEAEALGIGEIVDRGGAGCRDVEDARVGQRVLQAQSGAALLGGRLVAAFGFAAGGIGHGMRFVEHNHAVEIAAQPIHDLLDTGSPVLTRV